MKDLVVCISENGFKEEHPIKGEICTVLKSKEYKGRTYYKLKGYDQLDENGQTWGYCSENFRPIDDTFGPAICETIEQEIELEKVLN